MLRATPEPAYSKIKSQLPAKSKDLTGFLLKVYESVRLGTLIPGYKPYA